jgi:hypothetical protein
LNDCENNLPAKVNFAGQITYCISRLLHTFGTGSGDDVIVSGEGDDQSTENGGADIFVCGGGEQDTVTDFNEAEGDIAAPDCENV